MNKVVWKLDPHTQAKHDILRRYLAAWFPILNSYHGRIVYIDGFAGPGEYEGGEPGSPIIALDVAASHRRQMSGEIVFWFMEEDRDKANHLKQLVAARTLPHGFRVHIRNGKFHELLTAVLDDLEQNQEILAPTFAFIDPFGFSDVPMDLIYRLLKYRRTEAFINFQSSYVNRFVEHPNSRISSHIIELFGTDEVLKIPSLSGKRLDNLRYLYQKQLNQAARFVRFFSMNNKQDKPIYDLFFAGNHPLGHYKMKEAMWKTDPDGLFTFSDATDPFQSVLFTLDVAPQLLESICQKFSDQSNVLTDHILEWIRNDTAFLEKHMKAALRMGEQHSRFKVHPTKMNGEKRQKGSFPIGVLLDFSVL